MSDKKKVGLVQIYTGEGKGKTTAALGLSLRAVGRGLKVCFIQFCKGELSGEHLFVEKFPAFEIVRPGRSNIFTAPEAQLKEEARRTWETAAAKITGGQYDLIVLDEINIALYRGLLTLEQVLSLIDRKPEALELVLTGRYAPDALVQRADLVTEMRVIKHPWDQHIAGRLGIEF